MKQTDFIQTFKANNPEASTEEVFRAWFAHLGQLGKRGQQKNANPLSITAFCKHVGISRNTYYKNQGKYLPLYNNFLKNHTKDDYKNN